MSIISYDAPTFVPLGSIRNLRIDVVRPNTCLYRVSEQPLIIYISPLSYGWNTR